MLVTLLVFGGLVGVRSFLPQESKCEGLADSPWPMFQGGPKHTGRSVHNTSHVDGTEKWNFSTEGKVCSSPAIGPDGTIYVGSTDNNLYAVNPNGKEKWTFATNGNLSHSPVIDSNGDIYVGSKDGKLYAINPNGTEKWNFTTDHVVSSSPAIGLDGTIYVGSYDKKLYAVNPNGTKKWSFSTEGKVYSSPAIGPDGTIYVGSYDKKLYAVSPGGREMWSFSTEGEVLSSPAISGDGTILVGSDDGDLYALGGSKTTIPSAPKNLQVSTGDGEVSLTWEPPSDDGGNSITEYRIYRGTSSGNLTLYDSVDGNTTSFTDTEVTNDQTYYYKVSTVTSAGEGNKTIEVSATPTADDDDGGTPGFTTMVLLSATVVALAIYYQKKRWRS